MLIETKPNPTTICYAGQWLLEKNIISARVEVCALKVWYDSGCEKDKRLNIQVRSSEKKIYWYRQLAKPVFTNRLIHFTEMRIQLCSIFANIFFFLILDAEVNCFSAKNHILTIHLLRKLMAGKLHACLSKHCYREKII